MDIVIQSLGKRIPFGLMEGLYEVDERQSQDSPGSGQLISVVGPADDSVRSGSWAWPGQEARQVR